MCDRGWLRREGAEERDRSHWNQREGSDRFLRRLFRGAPQDSQRWPHDGRFLDRFVHAGIDPRYSLEEQSETDLVYIRSAFYNHPHNLKQKIIFGHTEFDKPLIQDDKICIDLGCGKYKNAKLCALILDEGREEFIYSD